eukprot:TCONS_00017787-protein
MGKTSSTLREEKRGSFLSPRLTRRKRKEDPSEGSSGNTMLPKSKKKYSKSEEEEQSISQVNNNVSSTNTKGRKGSSKSSTASHNGFVIERRRVLPKNPLQSIMQDGADGLYFWFVSTWMRLKRKHFDPTDFKRRYDGQKDSNKMWRESTLSDATSVFDLDNDIEDIDELIENTELKNSNDDLSVESLEDKGEMEINFDSGEVTFRNDLSEGI